MYLGLYLYLTFLFLINLKYKKINQDTLSFYTSIFLFIFFILNKISADQQYYSEIYVRDFLDDNRAQGYDYFFYQLSALTALIKYPKTIHLIIYSLTIITVYFFSKKFQSQFLILLLFYPFIFVVAMQSLPRQTLALVFFLISIIMLFKFKNLNQYNFINNSIILFSVFSLLVISTLFHYSGLILLISFIIFYIIFILNKSNYHLFFLVILFGVYLVFFFKLYDVYLIKITQFSDFYKTRDNYSSRGFFIRSAPIITSTLVIIYFNTVNFLNKKFTIQIIDKYFFTLSLIYLISIFIILFFYSDLILILDRFGIYFFLVFIYFIGRFQYFIISSFKYKNIFIYLSLAYSNVYLLLWTFNSPANINGEFKYCLFFLNC